MISWHKMTKSPVVFTQKQMGENVESKKKSNGCLVCTTVLMSKKHHKHHYDSEHFPSSDGYRTISPYSDSQRAISLSRCGHKAISLLRWHRAISLSRWPQNILPLEITIEQDRSRDCHRAIPPLWVAKHARSHARARTHTHRMEFPIYKNDLEIPLWCGIKHTQHIKKTLGHKWHLYNSLMALKEIWAQILTNDTYVQIK